MTMFIPHLTALESHLDPDDPLPIFTNSASTGPRQTNRRLISREPTVAHGGCSSLGTNERSFQFRDLTS